MRWRRRKVGTHWRRRGFAQPEITSGWKFLAKPLSVAIIGAGMGGLASAAALRRVGIDVTVYEQASQFARLGAGIQIGCNAMKVLRGLGLEARLRAQSFYPRSWNNRRSEERRVGKECRSRWSPYH